jgi:hypothetical protein
LTLPPLHPACAVLSQLPPKQLQALADDIAENGLHDAIVLDKEGRVLDGRNRWLACEMANVPVRTVAYGGAEPVRFVISKNERRRHETDRVRALIAGQLANMLVGNPQFRQLSTLERPISRAEAAEMMDVNPRAVDDARVILRDAAPNVVDAVKNGDIGLRNAARVAHSASKEIQAGWTAEDVKNVARGIRNGMTSGTKENDEKYQWPCIPRDLKEIRLNQEQHKVIKLLFRHFKDRRSQRILVTMQQEAWQWMTQS